jgi:hypothetical protein
VRALGLAAALFLGIAAWSAARATPAYACSVGNEFNPVAQSEVIVMGRVTDWRPVDTPTGFPAGSPFQSVAMTVDVDVVLKGAPAPRMEFIDVASYRKDAPSGHNPWAGSGGSCGALNDDPTGKYVLMGLSRTSDGSLRSGLPLTFFIGDREQLSGETYDRIRTRLAGFGLATLPSTGQGPPEDEAGVNYTLLALAGLFALGGASVVVRSRQK